MIPDFLRSLFGIKATPKQSADAWAPEPAKPSRPAVWATPKEAPAASEVAVADAVHAAPPPAREEPPPPVPSAPHPTPPPPAERSGTPWDIKTLLLEFETLGASPEFDLVRQKLRAAPDGLFGFASLYPRALLLLLERRFAGVGELENLKTKSAWGSYYVVDTRYAVTWRTEFPADQMAEPGVLAHEASRLTALRAQLLDNLAGGKRLFVYCGPAADEEIAAIRSAMRAYGDNALLHLVEADAANPARHVDWREPGLLRGYLGRYGSSNGAWNIALDDWVSVCRTAYSQWKSPSGN